MASSDGTPVPSLLHTNWWEKNNFLLTADWSAITKDSEYLWIQFDPKVPLSGNTFVSGSHDRFNPPTERLAGQSVHKVDHILPQKFIHFPWLSW